ncbi:MAG: serine hydrolase domain-containing protein, partial [Bacteroidota bacterium]
GENLQSYLQNHMPLDIAVGTSYEYSNLGMGILGYTLAQMANTTYEDLLKNTLTSPLDMTQTTTLLTNVDPELLVTPRTRQGEITSHWNFDETMSGAGSVKSSVQDMAKFIQYNFRNDEIVNRAQQAAFTIDNNLSMGLGWLIYEDEVFRIHTHDGGTGGFSSILMMDKEKQIGVIVLSNVANYDEGISPLCNDFILELYGRL